MREDIRKLEQLDKQVRLLGENNIETYEDLNSFREKCGTEKEELTKLRNDLRNKLRRTVRTGDEAMILSVKEEIAVVNDKLQKLKEDLGICDKVEERAEQIQAEYNAIKEQQNEREENENELLRGRSGTSREDVAKRR